MVRRALTATLVAFAAGLAASAIAGEPAAGQASSPWKKPASSQVSSPADAKSLEEFLSRALNNHPDILAAEAKLESIQAELTRTRFEITRELITLWNEWKSQSENVQRLEAAYRNERSAVVGNSLIEAKGKATETDAQVSYLLGQMGSAAVREPAAAESKRLPKGPMAAEVSAELAAPTELQFIKTPIRDLAQTVMDFHDITFVTDPDLQDVPVTIDLKGIPLGAALQALEDVTEGVRFVVCDYGILVTSDDSEAAATYISANEFWREQLPEQTTGQDSATVEALRRRAASLRGFAPRKPDASKEPPLADPFGAPKPPAGDRAPVEDPFGAPSRPTKSAEPR